MDDVDGAIWARSEHVGDDALEIGVEMLGAREGHGLQACLEGIIGGVVQAEQGALLCEREAGVLVVEVEGVAEKARGAGGEVIPGSEDGRVVGHGGVLSVWLPEAAS
ncbi:hypothetical protein KDH_00970 [Dictyobacter sp. S3.2.2.5]|uniref:Uncharacterized protein n=1 Tax=Dictyobacter halimunensis TaxID=3026934 RepID=A0ABQ6FL38_9CHLR|nr:hypothetical protein KDH_00970 [Dictyobacter sp. S3.2.2.5]